MMVEAKESIFFLVIKDKGREEKSNIPSAIIITEEKEGLEEGHWERANAEDHRTKRKCVGFSPAGADERICIVRVASTIVGSEVLIPQSGIRRYPSGKRGRESIFRTRKPKKRGANKYAVSLTASAPTLFKSPPIIVPW